IHLIAAGSARLRISRVEERWVNTVVSADPATGGSADAWISGADLSEGWTIAGTVERLRPAASDAIVVTVGNDPAVGAKAKPLTSTGGGAGPSAGAPSSVDRSTIVDLLRSRLGAGAAKAWTGAVSGAWSNPGNWADAKVPVSGDVLVFPASATRLVTTNDVPGLV